MLLPVKLSKRERQKVDNEILAYSCYHVHRFLFLTLPLSLCVWCAWQVVVIVRIRKSCPTRQRIEFGGDKWATEGERATSVSQYFLLRLWFWQRRLLLFWLMRHLARCQTNDNCYEDQAPRTKAQHKHKHKHKHSPVGSGLWQANSRFNHEQMLRLLRLPVCLSASPSGCRTWLRKHWTRTRTCLSSQSVDVPTLSCSNLFGMQRNEQRTVWGKLSFFLFFYSCHCVASTWLFTDSGVVGKLNLTFDEVLPPMQN